MAKPQDTCQNGHDLNEHGIPMMKNGVMNGRDCRVCKKKRGRRNYWNKLFYQALEETWGSHPNGSKV